MHQDLVTQHVVAFRADVRFTFEICSQVVNPRAPVKTASRLFVGEVCALFVGVVRPGDRLPDLMNC